MLAGVKLIRVRFLYGNTLTLLENIYPTEFRPRGQIQKKMVVLPLVYPGTKSGKIYSPQGVEVSRSLGTRERDNSSLSLYVGFHSSRFEKKPIPTAQDRLLKPSPEY